MQVLPLESNSYPSLSMRLPWCQLASLEVFWNFYSNVSTVLRWPKDGRWFKLLYPLSEHMLEAYRRIWKCHIGHLLSGVLHSEHTWTNSGKLQRAPKLFPWVLRSLLTINILKLADSLSSVLRHAPDQKIVLWTCGEKSIRKTYRNFVVAK